MRWAIALALVGGCSFEHGALSSDGSVDAVDAFQPTWSIDSASQKAVPATKAEWARLTTAKSITLDAPDNLWLMQETTGSLADTAGSAALDPTTLSSVPTSYNAAVSGWARHAATTPQLDGNRGFDTFSTGNLDNSTSYLLLLYVGVAQTPPDDRALFGIGLASDHRYVAVTPSGVLRAAGGNSVTGTIPVGTAVHPIVMKVDGPSSTYVVYSDVERLAPVWMSPSGQGNLVFVGNAILSGSANASYLYGALWQGPKSALSDADVKKLLQALGWTVTGY